MCHGSLSDVMTSSLCDVWMAVMQLVSATETVHNVAAVVYPLAVTDVPFTDSQLSDTKAVCPFAIK